MEDGNAGDVGERLRQQLIGVSETVRHRAEQAERPQHLACGSHRNGMHRAEPGIGCRSGELRPALLRDGQVGDHHGFPGGIAIQARPVVGLQLKELEITSLLGRRRHQVKPTARIRE